MAGEGNVKKSEIEENDGTNQGVKTKRVMQVILKTRTSARKCPRAIASIAELVRGGGILVPR